MAVIKKNKENYTLQHHPPFSIIETREQTGPKKVTTLHSHINGKEFSWRNIEA
jgi:hypothetical protein